jgi:RNA recognition motif. (a.k.a. RRM, RBD, or RNP domain)
VIENIPRSALWSDLRSLATSNGLVPLFTKLVSNNEVGFIDFGSKEEMARAIERLDGAELGENRIVARAFEHRRGEERRAKMDVQGEGREETETPSINYDDVDQREYDPVAQ